MTLKRYNELCEVSGQQLKGFLEVEGSEREIWVVVPLKGRGDFRVQCEDGIIVTVHGTTQIRVPNQDFA